jgi:CHAT domain-containing protein
VDHVREAYETDQPFHANTMDGRLPHITWCTIGPLAFLPLHAAGIYDGSPKGHKIFDFVVSSYTPTLSALLHARSKPMAQRLRKTLIVSQPNTPNQHPLPGTHREISEINKFFSETGTFLDHDQATLTAVLDHIRDSSCVHLACHGIQNRSKPLDSAFALYDGPLTLGNLMQQSVVNADLAFLSACQTAAGDQHLPEEAMHLAAGMLAVGYRSVIATMRAIDDADAPIVAKEFYSRLLEDRASGRESVAHALHDAVTVLRSIRGEEDFLSWMPFVHIGA